MIILQCHNVKKAFGTTVILENINLTVHSKERIGLIGKNGSGKTTLLRVLYGEYTPDEGEIFKQKQLSLGYLEQILTFETTDTLLEFCLSAFEDLLSLEKKLRTLEKEISLKGDDPALFAQYSKVTEQFERNGGYEVESRAKGILLGLGFEEEDFLRDPSTLSGGEKNRLQMARLLSKEYDLLILDEPTNHLDLKATAWLENHLNNLKGTVIFVTHDRYFLDKVSTRIVEIENHQAFSYEGNYSTYKEQKKIQLEILKNRYENQLEEYNRQLEIYRTFRQRAKLNDKFAKRAKDREKKLEKIEVIEKPFEENPRIRFHLKASHRNPKDVLSVKDLSKSWKEKLFDNISFTVYKDEIIGLIGDNGAGKTTILNILAGDEEKDSGTIQWGEGVLFSYYKQHQEDLHPEKNMIEEINSEFGEYSHSRIREMLSDYMFYKEDPFKTVGTLSGGEKARLSLFKLSLKRHNLLLLDEPTNHLDIFIKEELEDELVQYGGAILLVSHDRYFLNKVCTSIFELKNGRLTRYQGNYDNYLSILESLQQQEEEKQQKEPRKVRATPRTTKKDKDRKERVQFLEREMETLEEEIHKITLALSSPPMYNDTENYNQAIEMYNTLTKTKETLYEEWEILIEEE